MAFSWEKPPYDTANTEEAERHIMLIWWRLVAGRPMAGHMVLVHGIGVRILSGQPS